MRQHRIPRVAPVWTATDSKAQFSCSAAEPADSLTWLRDEEAHTVLDGRRNSRRPKCRNRLADLATMKLYPDHGHPSGQTGTPWFKIKGDKARPDLLAQGEVLGQREPVVRRAGRRASPAGRWLAVSG